MTSPRLPRRLRVVMQMLPDGARAIADVGAGHGALAFHLGATVTPVLQRTDVAERRHVYPRWLVGVAA